MSQINLAWGSEQGIGAGILFLNTHNALLSSLYSSQSQAGLEGVSLRGLKAPHCACSPVTIALDY